MVRAPALRFKMSVVDVAVCGADAAARLALRFTPSHAPGLRRGGIIIKKN